MSWSSPPQLLQIRPKEASGVLPGWWNSGGSIKVRAKLKGSFFSVFFFFFLTKILRKTQGGRGEEGGPNLAKCPQTLSMPLRGLLIERRSHFLLSI